MEEEEPLAESAHNKQRMIDKKLRKFRRESPEVIESVSYTHLRAHETGRNLVCRLLLEKKKKH